MKPVLMQLRARGQSTRTRTAKCSDAETSLCQRLHAAAAAHAGALALCSRLLIVDREEGVAADHPEAAVAGSAGLSLAVLALGAHRARPRARLPRAALARLSGARP